MKLKGVSALAAVLFFGITQGSNVFAANSYNINYSGGEPLGSNNVQIEPAMVSSLIPIMPGSRTFKHSNSSKWNKGYIRFSETQCLPIVYVNIKLDESISPSDNLSYSVSDEDYHMNVAIKNIKGDNLSNTISSNESVMVAVTEEVGFIYAGSTPYQDSTCTNQVPGVKDLYYANNSKLFVETEIKLINKHTNQRVSSDNMYYYLGDIDGSQSYKILNPNNELSHDNMYALSAEALQPADAGITARNMYVPSGKYIYSESNFGIQEGSDIYVKVNKDVQREGLNIVYGFGNWAGSGVGYYAKQFTIKYASDENGDITGITTERVISGENPSGSTSKPKTGYEFSHWVADVDVTLKDGTTIKAGAPIASSQLTSVIAEGDITFTAVQVLESNIAVPDTGASTENLEPATIASISVLGVLALALFIHTIPRLAHKNVKFD